MSARLVLAAALVAVGALAGCSGGGDPPASAPSGTVTVSEMPDIDPCGVVTQEEAEAAFGASLGPGEAAVEGDGVVCRYPAAIGLGSVSIFVYEEPEWDIIRGSYQTRAGSNFHDVDGVGDAAFTDGTDVFVRIGTTVVKFSMSGPFADGGARSLTLAQSANF
jgi:hypothetical protein